MTAGIDNKLSCHVTIHETGSAHSTQQTRHSMMWLGRDHRIVSNTRNHPRRQTRLFARGWDLLYIICTQLVAYLN